jgi:hypothetical protein
MKAKLIKTGEVVTLADKQGDYYLDENNNPYKEDELEFGVIDDTITPTSTDPKVALAKVLQGNHQQMLMAPALTFATEVVKAKPNLTAKGVAEFVETVITELKKAL